MDFLTPAVKKWAKRIGSTLAIALGTVGCMLLVVNVQAMFTPEAEKNIEELYDVKKANGVTLRSLNTVKMQQELDLARTNRQLAEVTEQNARVDVCIDKLQKGEDTKCNTETLKVSDSTSSGSVTSSSAPSQGF